MCLRVEFRVRFRAKVSSVSMRGKVRTIQVTVVNRLRIRERGHGKV